MSGLPMEQLQRLRNSTFTAFANLIDYAIKTKPDFVLIVGDIYDGEDRSLRAQLKFQEGMKKLDEANIPVVLSYGNHDHLKGNWTRFDMPRNVYIFQEEVSEVSFNIQGELVNIYGFSYRERHVREAMIDQYPVAKSESAIHIGMLHGSLEGDESHDVYAPFTKEALLSKKYDYWALGHIHKRQTLHETPRIVYAGNLQGRHRNERGMKGFYEVTLSKTASQLQFVPASTLVFDDLTISCRGIKHAGRWFDICEEAVDKFREQNVACVVELHMTDIDEETEQLFQQSSEDEWLEALRELMQQRDPFVWIHRLSFDHAQTRNQATDLLMNPVLSTLESWSSDDWQDVLKDVYEHTRSIKYVDRLSEESIKEIQEEAEKQLLAQLSARK